MVHEASITRVHAKRPRYHRSLVSGVLKSDQFGIRDLSGHLVACQLLGSGVAIASRSRFSRLVGELVAQLAQYYYYY